MRSVGMFRCEIAADKPGCLDEIAGLQVDDVPAIACCILSRARMIMMQLRHCLRE